MKAKWKMELYLKITAGLLLLVQAFHLASLQESTDSPGRTIDKSWLRELAKNTAGSQNAAVTEEETEYYQGADATAMESNNEYSGGIASGSMAVYNEEEENVAGGDKDASDDVTVVATTVPPTFPNVTTQQPELQDATVSPTTATTDPTNSSKINMTEAEEFHNSSMTPQKSTTHQSAPNSTSFPDNFNHTDLQTTTLTPESNATQESTTKPDEDTGLTNATESNNTTTVTTTTTPEISETSNTSSSTRVFLPETTETSPETTTAAALNTPEKANNTDKAAASGSSSERGTAAVSGVTVSGAQFHVQKTALCVFLVA